MRVNVHLKSFPSLKSIFYVGLIALCAFFAGCDYFAGQSESEHIANARAFLEKGQLRSSLIELKSAVKISPKNAEARFLLGSVYMRANHIAQAEKEFRRALQLGVKDSSLLMSYAEVLRVQGKNTIVLDKIEPPETFASLDRANLIAYRGDAWLADKKPKRALAEYRRALGIDSKSGLAVLGLARIARIKGEIEKVDELVAKALALAPNEPWIWSFQAEVQEARDEIDKAISSYSKAIEYERIKGYNHAKRALLQIKAQNYDAGKADIDFLKKIIPNHFVTHYSEGLLNFYQRDFAKAQTNFERVVSQYRENSSVHYFLGVSQLMQDKLESADSSLSRFVYAQPTSTTGRQLLGFTKYRNKDFKKAKEVLNPVLEQLPDDIFGNILMGAIEFGLGNSEQGMVHMRRVSQANPDAALSHLRVGLGKLNAGEKEQGLQQLETALSINPNLTQAEAFIALTKIRDKKYEEAIDIIKRMHEKNPDSHVALDLAGQLNLSQGNIEKAKVAFKKALTISPAAINTGLNLAELYVAENKYDQARSVLESVLKKRPGSLDIKLKLIELDATQGRRVNAETRLYKLIEESPKRIQPRLALARYYLQFGEGRKARTILEKMLPQEENNPVLLSLLVRAQISLKQHDKAIKTAEALIKAAPGSPISFFILAEAYAQIDNLKKIRDALQRALAIDAGFLQAQVAMVKLLVFEGKTREAAAQLSAVEKDFPDDPDVSHLSGWMAVRDKNFSAAAKAYEKTLQLKPSSPVTIDLADAQWRSGDKKAAIRTLESWRQDHPADTSVAYVLATLSSRLGKSDDAQKYLSDVISKDPRNALAFNDLAWLIRKKNKTQALIYAETAHNLKPDAWPISDTLAMVLLENDQPDRALTVMNEIMKVASDNPIAQYHLALVQAKNGSTATAIRTLKTILKDNKPFKMRGDAEQLLSQLTNG